MLNVFVVQYMCIRILPQKWVAKNPRGFHFFKQNEKTLSA